MLSKGTLMWIENLMAYPWILKWIFYLLGLLQDNPPIIPVGSQPTNWVAFSSNSQSPHQQPDQPPPLASNGNSAPSSVGLEQSVRSLEPIGEPWYVGQVTRQKAESLLQYDGDFLVRASTQSPNQFVLSGMQNGKKRHLLLINPEGQVYPVLFSYNFSALRQIFY